MALKDKISALAQAAAKKNNGNDGTKGWKWEQANLKDVESAVKQGAKWDKEKSKTGWTNPKTKQTFSAKHYKENYQNDIKALKRVKDEQSRRKLISGIKAKASDRSGYKLKKRDKIDDYLEQ